MVCGTGNRKTVNMISAVSTRGKLYFSLRDTTTNSSTFIDFCRSLLDDIPGRIFLIVDGHSAHISAATKRFIASTGGRLTLFLLPPYSPELNPDEWVRKNIKHDTAGRLAARTVDELQKGIEKAVARLQSLPETVHGFFGDPNLAYINI